MGRRIALLLATLTIALSSMLVASANAAEPPSLIVIVKNAPDDILITSALVPGHETTWRKSIVAWETNFVFYYSDFDWAAPCATLSVSGGGRAYSIDVAWQDISASHNSTINLNFQTGAYSVGKGLARSLVLVGLRLLITLAVEAAVFFAFCYRQKRSWLVFLAVNLVTQGALNLWLNSSFTHFQSYYVLDFILMEALVIIAECILFSIFLGEHRRRRGAGYALLANLLSAIAGSMLIVRLPI